MNETIIVILASFFLIALSLSLFFAYKVVTASAAEPKKGNNSDPVSKEAGKSADWIKLVTAIIGLISAIVVLVTKFYG